MCCCLFALTRHRKIGLLVTVVTFLLVAAALSSFYADEETHATRHRGVENSGGGRRSMKIKSRNSHNFHERSGLKVLHERGSKRNSNINEETHYRPEGKRRRRFELNKGDRKSHRESHRHNTEHNKEKKKPGPAISVKMADNQDKFDANRVLQLFSSCRKSDDQILIDCYVDAYEELCKLFKAFGTVFGFVTSDVVEKIGILRDYRKTPEAEHYATIQSLLSYEVEKGITDNKKKASGSRTLLRLHRALEFIEELLVKIRDTDNKDKFSTVACKAYDDTLAKHHPWLIKKAVHVAMYVLPTRSDLLKKMQLEDSENGMSALTKLIDELKIIYKITQDLYSKEKLLNLP